MGYNTQQECYKKKAWDATYSLSRANELCTGLQKFVTGDHLIPTATKDLCLVWKQMAWSAGQHSTYWADPHSPPPVVETVSDFTSSPSCTDTAKPIIWQAKLSLLLRRAFQLKAFQRFPRQTPVLNTWLWKFKQRGVHFVTVTFLPNNKVSHVEVLAVNKEWISSRSQRQFFYSCNMVMQNLKNRK